MISQLAQQLFQELKNNMPGPISLPEEEMKALLQSVVNRLDLVPRDEFDAQQAVLLRTRERLEALEKLVTELESQLNKQ